MCFAYFLTVIRGCLYNKSLAEVRSTGAEIKCLYCTERITYSSAQSSSVSLSLVAKLKFPCDSSKRPPSPDVPFVKDST